MDITNEAWDRGMRWLENQISDDAANAPIWHKLALACGERRNCREARDFVLAERALNFAVPWARTVKVEVEPLTFAGETHEKAWLVWIWNRGPAGESEIRYSVLNASANTGTTSHTVRDLGLEHIKALHSELAEFVAAVLEESKKENEF